MCFFSAVKDVSPVVSGVVVEAILNTSPVSPPSPFSPSGTTCLVALLSDKELIVANVGDSRGVLCDKDGNAVPLSHDHKPYQLKERKRIKKAGEQCIFVRQ